VKRIDAWAGTSERRDERIDAVIEKYWDVLHIGSDEPYFSNIEWDDDDDITTVTIWVRQDDKAEEIASELRGCGCVVTVHDDADDPGAGDDHHAGDDADNAGDDLNRTDPKE
jgi:hypothetical protein